MRAQEPIAELRVEGLRKRIGSFELHADLVIKAGERVALVGKSGIGKSSFLRLVAGLERLDSGRLTIGGKDITELPPQKREIGFVFQDQALFPSMDIVDNATFALRARGVSRSEREHEVGPWLERSSLTHALKTPVSELSGGEAQRIAFIRALIWRPRAILLDEPFSALDRENRRALASHLLELHAAWPVPLILVAHDEEDIGLVATTRCGFAIDGSIRRIQAVRGSCDPRT